MAYDLSVNMALCAIKISPTKFENDFQHYAKDVCKVLGLTPCEAAVVMLANDTEADCPKAAEDCIRKWRGDGSLNHDEPAVASALSRLGISVRRPE